MSIKPFENTWKQESTNTGRMFAALTDESLSQQVADDHRTLGRIAWHIVLTLGELGGGLGLKVDCPAQDAAVPSSAQEILNAYKKAASTLLDSVNNDWNDDKLMQEVELYGQKFTFGFGLWMAVAHEIHHRGQMTVVMRQAGLKVPGMYGPSLEEWEGYGAKPPEI